MSGTTPPGSPSRTPDEEASAYLAAIVASSDDAIIAKDLDGVIQSCNASAERLFGYTADELIGRSVRILIPDDRQTEEDEILAKIRRGERVQHFETVRRRKDGGAIDISLTVSPVRDARGHIVGVSKIARDITERKRIELERQEAARERERLLESERQARSEAEKASRVKDEFVAMVSHELRTPLNAILGWTQLMSQDPTDPRVIERGLDVVARNTRMQAQLIADLLDISRIATGKLQLETRPVDLAAILRESIDTVQREADIKGIEVVQHVGHVTDPVTGDPARLQQVIWNLLSNAIKFTPGGGRVMVTLSSRNGRVELVVTDTGVGIAPEMLPHIFERFQQADRSITRRFGGLGLGLSIVKHLVDLHGGTVRAGSAGPGQGATFTLTFPIATSVPAGVAAAPDVPPATTLHPASLEGLTVLVVEDEPDTREFLARALGHHGAAVVTAATAAEALARFRAARPDVLVSDIGLPDVDGYDLMRMIREETGGDAVQAIALTAYARSEDRARALGAGFQDHLSKPVHVSELIAALSRLRTPAVPGASPAQD